MVIVVEGPDGAGKTSLCEELSGRLNVPIFKQARTPLRGQPVEVSQAEDSAIMDMLEVGVSDVIFDRYYPSELCYGDVFKRQYDRNAVWLLDDRMAKLDAHLMVVLTHSLEPPFQSRMLERIDDEVDPDTVWELNKAYETFADNTSCNVVHVDTLLTVRQMVEQVMLAVVDLRPDKDSLFMAMAKLACERSTCLSRRTGAVLVSAEHHVLATGWNGNPSGISKPTHCPRLHLAKSDGYSPAVGSGQALEMCHDVHAEENCIAQAAKYGHSVVGSRMYTVMSPCSRCAGMMINAGVSEVIYERPYGDLGGLDLLDKANVKIRELK